jgi:Protein of unknown function (DUF4242)
VVTRALRARTVPSMAEFLVELYVSREDPAAVERGAERARRAGQELTHEGTPVRYLRSLYVPEDETCFFFYLARCVDDVREAARRAALPFDRISEAFESDQPGG